MPEPSSTAVLLSCEHATHCVPETYRERFLGADEVLRSHRGWDPGASDFARFLSARWRVPLHATRATRLLVEPNRSLHHPRLWSEFTASLNWTLKERILAEHYFPHRNAVHASVRCLLGNHRRVLHLSIHSFTPIWNGQPRPIDLALLFDPARPLEAAFAETWRARLAAEHPELRLALNRPYLGTDDGLTTTLRQRFPPDRYLGLELELNQALPLTAPFREAISRALRADRA